MAVFEWREVIAIFVDDDYGRGGISALGDLLTKKCAKISYKAAFQPGGTQDEIDDLLVHVNWMESIVYIVHVNPDTGLEVSAAAGRIGMVGSQYAWSPLAKTGNSSSSLNAYALYAYDTVWLIAHDVNDFLNEGGAISFVSDPRLKDSNDSSLNFSALHDFVSGQALLQKLLVTNFTVLTGQVQFSSEKSLIYRAFNIINIPGTGLRTLGYWSNYSGLLIDVPENLYDKPHNTSRSRQQLHGVIWPGDSSEKPLGWVFPNNGKPLGLQYQIVSVIKLLWQRAIALMCLKLPQSCCLTRSQLNLSYLVMV